MKTYITWLVIIIVVLMILVIVLGTLYFYLKKTTLTSPEYYKPASGEQLDMEYAQAAEDREQNRQQTDVQ